MIFKMEKWTQAQTLEQQQQPFLLLYSPWYLCALFDKSQDLQLERRRTFTASSSSSLQGHPGLYFTHNNLQESTDNHVFKALLTRPSREDLSAAIRLITFTELMLGYQQWSKETYYLKELSASDKRIQPTESK